MKAAVKARDFRILLKDLDKYPEHSFPHKEATISAAIFRLSVIFSMRFSIYFFASFLWQPDLNSRSQRTMIYQRATSVICSVGSLKRVFGGGSWILFLHSFKSGECKC